MINTDKERRAQIDEMGTRKRQKINIAEKKFLSIKYRLKKGYKIQNEKGRE